MRYSNSYTLVKIQSAEIVIVLGPDSLPEYIVRIYGKHEERPVILFEGDIKEEMDYYDLPLTLDNEYIKDEAGLRLWFIKKLSEHSGREKTYHR